MASFRKADGKWRAEVCCRGVRSSRRFRTKGAAKAWADQQEEAMRDGVVSNTHLLADALDKYAKEVSPTKKGARWEQIRLTAIKRSLLASKRVSSVTATHIAEWRDMRLQQVSGASVRREMGLLRSVFEYARLEWKWIHRNPMDGVKKPPAPQSRDRLLTPDEIENLAASLNGQYKTLFLLALETGMRLGELCAIQAEDIHAKHVVLPDTKNGTSRHVPLSTRARELIRSAPFATTSANASAVFYKAKKAAGIDDCTFHDTRHTACVNLSKVLNVLELARVLGMNDTKTLMIYYSESADSIADKLG